jgi:transcription elongation GreA/GreB family factor
MDENSRETVTLPALAHIPEVRSGYIIERGETIVSDNSTVKVGSMVRVRFSDGEEEYTIVGGEDADATSRRISTESPLAVALLGRAAGEQVRVRAPGGLRAVTILRVASMV